MDWWNITVFCVIPMLSVAAAFCIGRKRLWTAPLISTAVSVIISIAAMPSILSDREHRAMFFGIALPMHLAVVVVLTAIACVIAYVLHKKRGPR